MPLSLAHQFSRIALRYLFAPSCVLTLLGLLGIGALLSYISSGHRNEVIEASLPSLEQRLITGDFVTLNQLLRGTAKALALEEALVLTPKGRVVASYPDVEKLHLSLSGDTCRNRKTIRVQSETDVGILCWSDPRLTHLLIPLALGVALVLAMAAVGILSFRKLSLTLGEHAAELDRLTSVLIEPSTTPKYEMEPASLEGHRLITAINAFSSSKLRIRQMELEAERTKAIQEVARQVAHDIRSPLSTLSVVSQVATGLTGEQSELLLAATKRIESVADSLLKRKEFDVKNGKSVSTSSGGKTFNDVVDQAVRWKQVECRGFDNIKISYLPPASLMKLPVDVDGTELSRVLSNLLNNAIDAIGAEVGHVGIALNSVPQPTITVTDSGFGMSPEILASIGEVGVSFKEGGNGLGLSGARKSMRKWGGELRISSSVGKGTSVALVFPSSVPECGGVHAALPCSGVGDVVVPVVGEIAGTVSGGCSNEA